MDSVTIRCPESAAGPKIIYRKSMDRSSAQSHAIGLCVVFWNPLIFAKTGKFGDSPVYLSRSIRT